MLWKRLLGAQDHGWISISILCYVELCLCGTQGCYAYFPKMGIPGGVKRYYMDDIIVALLCQTPEDVTAVLQQQASTFVEELNKPTI